MTGTDSEQLDGDNGIATREPYFNLQYIIRLIQLKPALPLSAQCGGPTKATKHLRPVLESPRHV